MDMDFTNFLNKMGNETSGKAQKNPVEEKKPHRTQVTEDYEPRQRKKERYQEPEERYQEPEERYQEPKERYQEPKSVINEEFLDKAYDYAQGVIKVIRNNFKTTEEKVAMLESLQKAINYYLYNMGIQSQPVKQTQESTQTMSEESWNKLPTVSYEASAGGMKMNDLTGQEVKINPSSSTYNPRLNIGIRMTSEGKQEVDLSGITTSDINEMKLLAGMIGPEAESKKNEQLALKNNKVQQQFSQEALDEIAQAVRES